MSVLGVLNLTTLIPGPSLLAFHSFWTTILVQTDVHTSKHKLLNQHTSSVRLVRDAEKTKDVCY